MQVVLFVLECVNNMPFGHVPLNLAGADVNEKTLITGGIHGLFGSGFDKSVKQ